MIRPVRMPLAQRPVGAGAPQAHPHVDRAGLRTRQHHVVDRHVLDIDRSGGIVGHAHVAGSQRDRIVPRLDPPARAQDALAPGDAHPACSHGVRGVVGDGIEDADVVAVEGERATHRPGGNLARGGGPTADDRVLDRDPPALRVVLRRPDVEDVALDGVFGAQESATYPGGVGHADEGYAGGVAYSGTSNEDGAGRAEEGDVRLHLDRECAEVDAIRCKHDRAPVAGQAGRRVDRRVDRWRIVLKAVANRAELGDRE
jgi:hypothetical protein